eukprot:gene11050-biopygen7190
MGVGVVVVMVAAAAGTLMMMAMTMCFGDRMLVTLQLDGSTATAPSQFTALRLGSLTASQFHYFITGNNRTFRQRHDPGCAN